MACTPCHCAVSIGSLHHKHDDKWLTQKNDCLPLPDGNVHLPDNVNVSENDESADEPVSESLDRCTERSFLSQRQCRLNYQQLRNSDLCLEENFSALMHGNNSDGRLCVLEVCAVRDSPLANTDIVLVLLTCVDFSSFGEASNGAQRARKRPRLGSMIVLECFVIAQGASSLTKSLSELRCDILTRLNSALLEIKEQHNTAALEDVLTEEAMADVLSVALDNVVSCVHLCPV